MARVSRRRWWLCWHAVKTVPERRPAKQAARPDRVRVFFAIWPNGATAKALHQLARDAQAECGGRLMRLDTLHLTLAFIGDVPRDRLPVIVAAGDSLDFPAFKLELERLGSWQHNHIVWAGTDHAPAPLGELVASLHARLKNAGFPLEERRFAPHVTLLRRIATSFAQRCVPALVWPVCEFVLVESVLDQQGSRYRPIARWPATREAAD